MGPLDTAPEILEMQYARLRRMTPAERMEEGVRLCRFAREMMRAGIRKRHPGYGEDDVELALARLLWGDELFRKAMPGKPRLEP